MSSIYEWEARYQRAETPWDKGEASPGLVDFLAAHQELPRGTVCVPGCGVGHDARRWAAVGFDTLGCDLAPSAIRLAQERSAGLNLPLNFQQGDFLTDTPPQKFDWLFEHTLFCAINPQSRDDYVRAAVRWLKPDGQFLAVYYLIPDTDGPPFGTTRDEILTRFSPHFDLVEQWVPRSYPNREGLEWMVWWKGRVAKPGVA